MKFTKMHGLGNDYVYVNCFEEKVENPEEVAVKISDRHFGVGADGLILICPSDVADVRMRMFNSDGSEAQMCGNGIRCVAKYTFDHGLARGDSEFSVPGQETFKNSLRVETGRGILKLGLAVGDDGKVEKVCVNMGQPILKGEDIPVALNLDEVIEEPIEVEGDVLRMTCVGMGNPHAVFFVDEGVNSIVLPKIGPKVENHDLFPERVNGHWVEVHAPDEFTMVTWERGSGITMACGTGACACGVAGVLTGKTERVTKAHLPGGDLELNWCEEDNCVYMTGPATEVFTGEWPE
ncbi:Diaminopimelate epimerase [Anaerohalosphaera lusitana]|uniref:Diaminopimelate epimerase n=1 Tax=Anaerohalosphaera lusitana TaxID=1936003 RepID=A0A1U9NLG5_9BACT|nr:diaminopimelate epimerase [Anaerohalosphaera lusitana]AQT68410.1 Diaminopimelate epimerase [Anaerohalosphaera lusitana]